MPSIGTVGSVGGEPAKAGVDNEAVAGAGPVLAQDAEDVDPRS